MTGFPKRKSIYADDPLMYDVVGACFEVHRELRWALYERAYRIALAHLLAKRGHKVVQEAQADFFFQGEKLSTGLFIDILVDDRLIIELKATECVKPEHHDQLHTYMLLTKKPLGLLVNFHARDLRKDALYRKYIDEVREFYRLPAE